MKDFIAELMKLKVFPKFGVYESDCEVLSPDAQTFENDVYDLARKYGIRIQTAYGVSQYVIILPDKTVIKIPFLGFYYGDPYAEDETECNDAYFERFDNNYSEVAVEVYQDALLKGIGEMFSKIEKIGFTSNGHPIYKQEYAESLCSKEIDVKEDSLTKAKEMEHNIYLPEFTLIQSHCFFKSELSKSGDEFTPGFDSSRHHDRCPAKSWHPFRIIFSYLYKIYIIW